MSILANPASLVDTAPLAPEPPRISCLGMKLHVVSESQAVEFILAHQSAGCGGWVITPNLDHLRRYRLDKEFAAHFGKAQLILADGMPLVWAAWLQGTPLPQRVAGSDLIWSLSALAAQRGIPIYLLGGEQGAAAAAGRVLKERNPELIIAGIECPDYGFDQDPAAVEAIARRLEAAQPGIIFVGLGSPKQEELIQRIHDRLPRAWWLGVGISFSFVSGNVKRAPRWMRRMGMEWVHRLLQEPRRLARRYLLHDLPFAFVLFWGVVAHRFGLTKKPVASICQAHESEREPEASADHLDDSHKSVNGSNNLLP